MDKRFCKIEGCQRRHSAKGLCELHYRRMLHGNFDASLGHIRGKYWIGKTFSEEHRNKIASSNRGRKLSDETKERMSVAAKEQGRTVSFAGQRHTLQTKEKMRLAKLGVVLTEKQKEGLALGGKYWSTERRRKNGIRSSGANCSFWKGGIAGINHSERSVLKETFEHQEWRRLVFERDNFTCRLCGNRGGILNAHHIKPWAAHPELRLDIDNGLTLCGPCHLNHHKEMRKRGHIAEHQAA